ncbi:MAG: hypothetical protein GY875_03595 [Gammaproteobacteria bacterium]|nr:hypothetical protein [Gammaproteobacteria bacterium]
MDTLLNRRRSEFISWSSFALLAMTMLPASASTIVINEIDADTPGPVPVPAAIWLFITAIIGVLGISKQKLTIIKRDRLKVSQLTGPINSVAI